MRILIVSALFPPDVAPPAPYIKELAARFSHHHTVTVLTYGAIPEAAAAARIVVVPKRLIAPLRLGLFSAKLWLLARQNDLLLVHNAPATEAPLLLSGFWFKQKSRLIMSDQKIVYAGWRRILHQLATRCVASTIHDAALPPRPEIHPFKPAVPHAEKNYEAAWHNHLNVLIPPPSL